MFVSIIIIKIICLYFSAEVCIMLDISGDHCVGVCQQLLEGEGEGVYVSPNGEQGTRDTEAFEQFISIRMTM